MTVRTRVAPSPTGDPHLGTAYMSLFNRAFAKHHGGKFVLRIEDTDQARSTGESESVIYDALRWMGVDWDEGPDIGGPYGPYRQSERLELYQQHAKKLIDDGNAFHCFCTPERLDEVRRAQQAAGETTRYDGHCLNLSTDEVNQRIDAGEQHVVRLRVPDSGECEFIDEIRDEIRIPWSQIDMQVLVKSDGFPTYHLAVVVDDHLMEITHVLRGEEWINSVPKHVLLYQHFGWQMPAHYHLPLLRNPDQSKMSKRKHPTGINFYRQSGYLPEALLNYLAMMGWSMPDEREIFSFDEMVAVFDAQRITPRGPIFDTEKLNWLNGQYIRNLSEGEFVQRVSDWAINQDNLTRLVPLIQERTERFIDIVPQVDYLLGERAALTAESFEHKTLTADDCKRVLDHTGRMLDPLVDWERDRLFDAIKGLADAMQFKLRDYLFPLFVAVSGRDVSLPLFDSMVFLGPDLTRTRIRSALEALGGVSKKEGKRFEKAFREIQAHLSDDQQT